MAKYHGNIGFAKLVTGAGSITTEEIVEKPYSGDLLKLSLNRQSSSEQLIDEIKLNHELSIIADDFAMENFGLIRYAILRGTRWRVTAATVDYPRLKLTMGGVYNGPTPNATP